MGGHQELEYAESGALSRVTRNGTELFQATSDPAGRWTGISSAYRSGAEIAITYDGFSRRAAVAHSGGPSETLSYDALNRVSALSWSGTGSQGMSEALTYSDAGRITSAERELGKLSYSYDPIDQLTSTTYAGSSLPDSVNRSMVYDPNGNRISDSERGNATLLANQLLLDRKAVYSSDELGLGRRVKMASSSITEFYDYRADGLMTRFRKTQGSKTTDASYAFDALGRRVAKKVSLDGNPSFTQSFFYLGNSSEVLMAKAGNGEEYLYLKGQGVSDSLAEIGPGGARPYVKDHLGSVLNSEAAGGAMAYGSFGEPLGTAPALSATTNPYIPAYAGYAYDVESGFYRTMYRLLDSKTGRWVTRDPIGFSGSLTNLYSYVANSPLNFIDPLGLTQKQIDDAMAWLRANHPELMGTTPPTVLDGPLPNGTDGRTNPFTGTITIDTSQSKSMVDIVDSVAHELLHRLQSTSEVIFNALFNPKEADKQHGDIITKAQEISQQYKTEMKNQGNTCPLR